MRLMMHNIIKDLVFVHLPVSLGAVGSSTLVKNHGFNPSDSEILSGVNIRRRAGSFPVTGLSKAVGSPSAGFPFLHW